MAKQTINIGADPNDGTGDALRTGAGKINDNFTELYSTTASNTSALTGKIDTTAIDTDSTFAANSDTKVPSQKAVKTAIDGVTSPWTTWAPTITPGGGAITTLGTVTARFKQVGKTVMFSIAINITTNGTANSNINFTLPVAARAAASAAFTGFEGNLTGKLLSSFVNATTTGRALYYDSTYPGADGARLVISGTYEAA